MVGDDVAGVNACIACPRSSRRVGSTPGCITIGNTWKQNLTPGEWKFTVETEYGRTVAVHRFELSPDLPDSDREHLLKRF